MTQCQVNKGTMNVQVNNCSMTTDVVITTAERERARHNRIPGSEEECREVKVTSWPMSLGRRDGLMGGRPCCMLRCSCKSVSQLKHLQGHQHSHTDCH